MIIKSFGPKPGAVKSASVHIAHQIRYCSQTQERGEQDELRPLLTNCAADDSRGLIDEFKSISTLRPDLKNPTRHVVLSPESGDRILTPEEWQRAVDIYRQERGLGDAPYVAYLHDDGHDGRHPHHLHVFFCALDPMDRQFQTHGTHLSTARPAGESRKS